MNLAEKRQSDNSVLPGYAYAFDYDDIGNRETATANGRVSNYSSDALNRYLARGTPLWADVRGKALGTASVLVNDELATRTGEDFYLAAPVSGLKENALRIQAARPSPEQAVTEDRSVLVPAVPESFVYDADGNLTQDGLWNYEWDGENRLKAQELRSDVATTTWKRLEYAYDGQGRRVQKVVKSKTGGAWTTLSDTRFLYDGWNLLAEYAYSGTTFTLVRSHAWGLDLSGSAQGAGGVGGLLWTKVAATAKTYAAGSDANGNVVVYVDCADGSVAGRRDYGPFGEAVMTTGVAASLPFGSSTKFEEKETGLYYYGLRYYNPSTGRWPSRDPIEERDAANLYLFVRNSPLENFDYLGMATIVNAFTALGKRGVKVEGRSIVYGETDATGLEWSTSIIKENGYFRIKVADGPKLSGWYWWSYKEGSKAHEEEHVRRWVDNYQRFVDYLDTIKERCLPRVRCAQGLINDAFRVYSLRGITKNLEYDAAEYGHLFPEKHDQAKDARKEWIKAVDSYNAKITKCWRDFSCASKE